MLTRRLSPQFHAKNRQTLAGWMGDDAVAVIDTADVITRTGDFEYPFHPDPNFYYLTGISEPQGVLVLIPGHANPDLREILFVSGTSDFVADWEGARMTPEMAHSISGIKQVYPVSELEPILSRLLAKYQTVYLNTDESLDSHMSSPSKRRAAELSQRAPLHVLKSVLPQLALQRTTKDPAEIDLMRSAVDIVAAGLHQAIPATRPKRCEYELEAVLTSEFIRQGAAHSFTPIIAAGANATVIHYMKNESAIGPDDLVLYDVGAEVGYYAADISRVVPASGKFTDRQRAVYEAVRTVQLSAIALHRPGTSIWEIDQHMQVNLIEQLVSLGVMTKAQGGSKDARSHLRKYYAHISHHLGLDVHDAGDARTVLAPGMVVTCEPGLYLKKEGIGVRLEDDILITATGHEVLSKHIPSSVEDIEMLAAGRNS